MNDYSLTNTVPIPVKLRIEDYRALDAAGAFDHYAKTELLGGELFYMNAQHRPHARLKMDFYDALRDALRAAASPLRPLTEASVEIPAMSIPEPDIVLTSEPYGAGYVPAASVALIVEIADTTVQSDLTRKASLYAEAGIPEYWVVDLPERRVHQHWAPSDGAYRERRALAFGERLEAVSLPLAIDIPEA